MSQIQIYTLDPTEIETLRLRYIKNLNQSKAASRMNISQSQYQRDLQKTIDTIVKALINGDAIHIKSLSKFSKNIYMKILIPSDSKDPKNSPSEVFGRSKYFAIYNTETKEINFIDNPGNKKARGAGMAASQTAIDQGVEKVIAGRIGPNAMDVLERGGIKAKIQEVKNKSIQELFNSEN